MKGRVLVKLAPEVTVRGPALQAGWTQNTALNQTLAAQNILRLDRILPGVSEVRRLLLSGRQPDVARWYRAKLCYEEADVQTVVEVLSRAPGVEYVEPGYIARPGAAPHDPRYGEQWRWKRFRSRVPGPWSAALRPSSSPWWTRA